MSIEALLFNTPTIKWKVKANGLVSQASPNFIIGNRLIDKMLN